MGGFSGGGRGGQTGTGGTMLLKAGIYPLHSIPAIRSDSLEYFFAAIMAKSA